MNPTLRKYSSFEEMKRDEYRYWQSRPAYERFEAVEEMVKAAWELRGWAVSPSEPRSEVAAGSHAVPVAFGVRGLGLVRQDLKNDGLYFSDRFDVIVAVCHDSRQFRY